MITTIGNKIPQNITGLNYECIMNKWEFIAKYKGVGSRFFKNTKRKH